MRCDCDTTAPSRFDHREWRRRLVDPRSWWCLSYVNWWSLMFVMWTYFLVKLLEPLTTHIVERWHGESPIEWTRRPSGRRSGSKAVAADRRCIAGSAKANGEQRVGHPLNKEPHNDPMLAAEPKPRLPQSSQSLNAVNHDDVPSRSSWPARSRRGRAP